VVLPPPPSPQSLPGMSIARQVLDINKVDGRDQLVIFVTDGVDSFKSDLLAQAAALKTNGVRVITIAAGAVVTAARLLGLGALTSKDERGALATLRDAATSCVCTDPNNGAACTGGEDSGWICMGTAKCTGDCYQRYQHVVNCFIVVQDLGCFVKIRGLSDMFVFVDVFLGGSFLLPVPTTKDWSIPLLLTLFDKIVKF
jgi:hypothetical protein